jgi:hypothetical protein
LNILKTNLPPFVVQRDGNSVEDLKGRSNHNEFTVIILLFQGKIKTALSRGYKPIESRKRVKNQRAENCESE